MTSQNKNLKIRFVILGVLFLGALFFYLKKEKQAITTEAPLEKPIVTFAPKPVAEVKASVAAASGVPAKNEQAAHAQDELTQNLSAAEKKQWQTFVEIMLSKNDNDPRLDKDLRHLSPALKKSLEAQYSLLPDEKRNEKGLVVFLVARDVSSPEDVEFLDSIYQESPCLSLADCGVRGEDDPHFSSINQMTLLYPQVAGLFQLDKQLGARPELLNDPNFKNQMRGLIHSAEQFPVPAIQKRAADLKNKYGL